VGKYYRESRLHHRRANAALELRLAALCSREHLILPSLKVKSVNPESGLSQDLERIYSRRFDSNESYRNLVWKTLIEDWFQRYVPRDAAVLDLGCGYGQFINHIQCAQKYAMDLNPGAIGRLNPDITIHRQDCTSKWDFDDETLDVIFTSNFFEHLPSKEHLAQTIAEARRCLRSGGKIIAMGPNVKFVGGAYWDYFDHHIALTDRSLVEALETAGFQTEYARDRFLPYTMVNSRHYPISALRLYLRLPILWKVFGKQFLVIAAKPD
jgi:SAM-dependent methyltransferase